MEDVAPSASRRGLLAGLSAGTIGALAGCTDRLWSQAEGNGPEQVSLTIKTVPADDDPVAANIAGRIRENYRAAGIEATPEPLSEAELYRDVLLEGNYDVFVARSHGLDEYDALYGLLHSQFVSEPGWQNPFHVADVTTDDYLETQRAADEDDRAGELAGLTDHLLQTTPYTAVAYPYRLSGARNELDVPTPPRTALDYLEILAHSDNGPRDGPLEVGVFGEELTERLNPLVVDRNRINGLLDLLYDPLARRIDGEYVPWLAEEIEWSDESETRPRARITLRDGLSWHDGESIDADDVAFTASFLGDTSMGAVDGGIPAQRYRSRQLLVETTEVVDSQTITLFFTETTRSVAQRTLSIPILPEHIWSERTDVVGTHQTQAIINNNVGDGDPVGSGLFVFGDDSSETEVELEPFEDHVLRASDHRPSVLENGFQFDRVRFHVAPNPGSMVDALLEDEIDLTASELPPEFVDRVREADGVSTVTGTPDGFYIVGYNTHHPQLGNPHFRRICSRLIDREYVVEEILDGFAEAALTPNALIGIHDDDWEFDDEFQTNATPEVLAFPGSDGEIDTSRAQTLFQGINYSYSDDGALLE